LTSNHHILNGQIKDLEEEKIVFKDNFLESLSKRKRNDGIEKNSTSVKSNNKDLQNLEIEDDKTKSSRLINSKLTQLQDA
jgi:hypothetical protein